MAQKVLLTGGAGFIGSHTFVELTKAGYQVVILDNFSNADRGVLDRLEVISGENVVHVDGDVLDQDLLTRVFAEHEFDAVIHFAALKAVGESTEKPLDYLTTNISGLYTLLNVMKEAGVLGDRIWPARPTTRAGSRPAQLQQPVWIYQAGLRTVVGASRRRR